MGAWGTALYSNDTASDIRGDYVDLLRRGNSNEEALKKLMEKNRYCIGDEEEEPLFWYALADTLWNYGRLTPEVKERIDQIRHGIVPEGYKKTKVGIVPVEWTE